MASNSKSYILVTGGTGFIGSHTSVALLDAGYDVLILDNLSNSHADVVDRIGEICGRTPEFIQGDIRDKPLLKRIFSSYGVSSVMHFAGLKAVGESVEKPLYDYAKTMKEAKVPPVKKITIEQKTLPQKKKVVTKPKKKKKMPEGGC